jgi:hypothetical protein
MSTVTLLVVCLTLFDLGLCVTLYFVLRATKELNGSVVLPVGAGMAGFVFHAFMFFDGAFRIVQLAAIAALFGIVMLEVRKRKQAA